MAAVLLVFMLLMDITIGGMTFVMYQQGLTDTLAVAHSMIGVGIFTMILLWKLLRLMHNDHLQHSTAG